MKKFLLIYFIVNSVAWGQRDEGYPFFDLGGAYFDRTSACGTIDTTVIPFTPYVDSSYITFSGGQLMRFTHLYQFDLIQATSDSFDIEFRVKLTAFGARYIAGQWGLGADIIISHGTNFANSIEIYLAGAWYQWYLLSGNTDWHTYRAIWHKSDSDFVRYVDGVERFRSNAVLNATVDVNAAFAWGHFNQADNNGYAGLTSVGTNDWFRGSLAYIKMKKDDSLIVDWNPSGGIGSQFPPNKVSWNDAERLYFHPRMGYAVGKDTCDPVYVTTGVRKDVYKYYEFEDGLRFWAASNLYGEAYVLDVKVSPNGTKFAAGGVFDTSATTSPDYVTIWNGTAFTPLGTGLNTLPICLEWKNNDSLFVGGTFTTANGVSCTRIAKWQGTTFQPLRTGCNEQVNVMKMYSDSLIVAGAFTLAGGIANTLHIAKWFDSTWTAMSTGLTGGGWGLEVRNGRLYASTVDGVYRWDYTSWTQIFAISGGGVVYVLFNDSKNRLWFGGEFVTAGGITCNGIGYWDESGVHSVGTGVSGMTVFTVHGGAITSICEWNGKIVAAGSFRKMNNKQINMIALYNGQSWCPLDLLSADLRIEALAVWGQDLIIAGDQTAVAGLESQCIIGRTP